MDQENKPVDATKQVQPSQPAQTVQASSNQGGGSGSKVGLIIVIIVLVLVVLGVAGYFILKSTAKSLTSKITATQTATALITSKTPSAARTIASGGTATATSGGTAKMNTQVAIDAVKYPGGTMVDQKQGENPAINAAELEMNSTDSLSTIKSYYQDLTKKNGWKVSREGTSGENNYYMTFDDVNFNVELDLTKYDAEDFVTISIDISGENLTSSGVEVN